MCAVICLLRFGQVSLDVIKYYYAKLINWDALMYDESADLPANAAKCV